MPVLAEAYRGKAVLATGGTGFLGTALVEKMLRSLPTLKRLYLLIRPSREKGAKERFESDVLGSPAFQRLREELGSSFVEWVAEKVRVLEGDVHADSLGLGAEDLAELSREVDVIVHSAASVVFDAPLDAAVDSNVRGTLGLLALARGWEKRPLFVHVSTSYVAGTKEGLISEKVPDEYSPSGVRLVPRAEITHLEEVVREVEEASKEKGLVRRLQAEAHKELGTAKEGVEVWEKVEQLRQAWVRERLVERGNERAQAFGWQDVYTFTKSLAERRMLEERGDLPLVILRPAIIESSLVEPHPGWIQGSRMMDPIIMAFGRGILREFPGDPDAVVDLVPVDHVVNATIAAMARGLAYRPTEPEVYQVASGERNPLRFRDLYEHVREYFLAKPLRDSGGRPIPVPEWSFPGRRWVERGLKAELLGLKVAGKLALNLPEGHLKTDLRGRIVRAERQARTSFYFSRIYGAYANMKSIFSSVRTVALFESLSEEDRRVLPFDAGEIDWRAWLQETHLPAITQNPGRKKRRKAPEKKVGEVAAVFDVDGTLLDSNVVSYYAWMRMQELPTALRPLWAAAFVVRVPYYWLLDKISRAHFNRVFYKNYKGWKPARARVLAKKSFSGYALKRLYPEAIETLKAHKSAGHRIVLLSGALDFVLEPFEDLADDVLAARLKEENGVYTGELSGGPVAGQPRARMFASFARRRNLDLSRSYAYADSISDLPMLEAVGTPVVVNPDARLRAAAKERGWQIKHWSKNGAQSGSETP
ncbi:MAG TPA: HAD-IB family hydrolase [Rubrobacteraceae bacterium]|nr:HAD-IB family hydrolase [Rubrobacteraceae bacterium]